MITNSYGLPVQEPNDLASPGAMAKFAAAVDDRLRAQYESISDIRSPEIIVGGLTGNKGPFTSGSTQIDFRSKVYRSGSGGDVFFGLQLWGMRPGIYHCGTTVDCAEAGAVTSLKLEMRLADKRGPKLLNDFYESLFATSAPGGITSDAITVSGVFEVHSPTSVWIMPFVTLVGGGNYTVLANKSWMWAYRLRGLDNV
jgi:hypothetical protein